MPTPGSSSLFTSTKIKNIATVTFYNQDKEVLVQIRGAYSKHGETHAFFGGGIQEGESYQAASIREIKEELGIDIKFEEDNYLGFFETLGDGFVTYRHAYVVYTEMKIDEFTVLEGEGATFVSIAKARTLKFPSDLSDVLDAIEENIENLE